MSDKIKEIKRLLDVIKITDWSEIGDRIDEIKLIFNDIEKPKRKPLSDGTLPLTKEEIKTVEEMTGIYFIAKVVYTIGKLRAVILADSQTVVNILNVKAILWLADRFELTSNN